MVIKCYPNSFLAVNKGNLIGNLNDWEMTISPLGNSLLEAREILL